MLYTQKNDADIVLQPNGAIELHLIIQEPAEMSLLQTDLEYTCGSICLTRRFMCVLSVC